MNVGCYGFNVMFLHQGSLMKTSKESDLKLTISILFANNLGRPVRESLLLGIYNLMERSTWLSKPVFIAPGKQIIKNQVEINKTTITLSKVQDVQVHLGSGSKSIQYLVISYRHVCLSEGEG